MDCLPSSLTLRSYISGLFKILYHNKNFCLGFLKKSTCYSCKKENEFTLNKNGTVERLYCSTSSDCTNYKGTYSISGDYLYIQLTQYQTYSGSWEEVKRDSDAPMEFAILSQTSFKDAKTTYYLDN